MIPDSVKKYLAKNTHRHFLDRQTSGKYRFAIVVPVYSEYEKFPSLIDGILQNDPGFLAQSIIVAVINNPPQPQCDSAKLADNSKLIRTLKDSSPHSKLNLFHVDASSPGFEIEREEGVGTARKIGMDIALSLLDWESTPIIISLDADTSVEGNYIKEILRFFSGGVDFSGASIHFEHQPGATPEEEMAIIRYEMFLRYYVRGLRISHSPYAYHTLGSAMAFPALSYVRAGGMKRRNGGEDFYFMQSLRKIGRIGQICRTTVHPSSRVSDRVPFGTGPKIGEYIKSGNPSLVCNPEVFFLLKKLYSSINGDPGILEPGLGALLDLIPEEAREFLILEKLPRIWPEILKNTPRRPDKIIGAFNTWFDALKTLRFIHFCESRKDKFPKIRNVDAIRLLACPCSAVFNAENEKEVLDLMRAEDKLLE